MKPRKDNIVTMDSCEPGLFVLLLNDISRQLTRDLLQVRFNRLKNAFKGKIMSSRITS